MVHKDPVAELSLRVTERLASLDGRSPVEVVVEMQPVAVPASGSRASRIEAVRTGFEEELRGVAERIAAAGGEVLETAWINQTVRGSIPAGEVVWVAEDDAAPLAPASGDAAGSELVMTPGGRHRQPSRPSPATAVRRASTCVR
jgi:hypothetical protein